MMMRLSLTATTALLFAVVACNAESPMQALPDVAKPGEGGYVRGELIYPLDNTPTPQCHASTIEETTQGFVAAWFGGTHEKNKDVGIWVSRLEDNAWSEPVEVADGVQSTDLRYPCWNPILFQPADAPLMLFYKVGPSPSEWWGMLITSQDGADVAHSVQIGAE